MFNKLIPGLIFIPLIFLLHECKIKAEYDPAVLAAAEKKARLYPRIMPAGGQYTGSVNVQISTITPGVEIKYSVNGSDPAGVHSLTYSPGQVIRVDTGIEIRAVGKLDGETSLEAHETYEIREEVKPVGFSVTAGTYNDAQTVQLSTPTALAKIRYTTDGSTPTSEVGELITEQDAFVLVTASMTIKAIAYTDDGLQSAVVAKQYVILQAEPPEFSKQITTSPAYSVAVTIGTETSGTSIRFTTNGANPTSTEGTLYTGPVVLSSSTNLKAVAYFTGTSNVSAVSAEEVFFPGAANPAVFSPSPGSYSLTQNVQITSTTSGATIRYTTDGSLPTAEVGTIYSAPIEVGGTTTIKAIVIKDGLTTSEIQEGLYTIRAFNTQQIYDLALASGSVTPWVPPAPDTYGQLSNEGLTAEITRAKGLLATNPSLITNTTTRTKFLAQSSATAASELCTTISPYLYLRAYKMLYPDRINNLPAKFGEYYLYVVNKGYVTTDSGGITFNWVLNTTAMIRDFVHSMHWYSWVKYRTDSGLGTDGAQINYVANQKSQIALFRDSSSSTAGSHTFFVVLANSDGEYRMIDTDHHHWTGKKFYEDALGPSIYRVRFGPSGTRWLHNVRGYVASELQ